MVACPSVGSAAGPKHPPTARRQPAVDLRSAANFVILSKSGITDVFPSAITGNIGTSPITGAAILLTCGEVAGRIYTVDAAGPAPCHVTDATRLTKAVGDMQTASCARP